MSFIDNVRRRFASIGSNPSYKKDDPRSYGEGTLIDLPCLYAVKDNFDIVTDDEDLREELEQMFRDINIENILYGWLRNARIFGTGYLEWTGDNLVLRSSKNMFVKRNEHGQVMYYYQKVGDDKM